MSIASFKGKRFFWWDEGRGGEGEGRGGEVVGEVREGEGRGGEVGGEGRGGGYYRAA